MGFRMKTTLNIDETVVAELKREAARQGRTMSEMVETALRLLLRSQRKRVTTPRCRVSAAAAHLSMTTCITLWKGDSARRARARDRANLHAGYRFQQIPV